MKGQVGLDIPTRRLAVASAFAALVSFIAFVSIGVGHADEVVAPVAEPVAGPDVGSPSCYGACFVESLGSLERQALETALAFKHLELDSNPQGKRVRRVVVYNLDVFVPSDGKFLRWFNRFHVTTKPQAIAQESVLRAGMMWSDDLVYETTRKFRDKLFSVLAIATAVTTGEPDTVDLLIVTRDIWSLRANSDFRLQGDRWTYVRLSISENNALGLRKLASAAFELNESDFFVGPLWIDKNVGGTHHYLSVTGGPVFGRATSQREGFYSEAEFSKPLFSLDSKWGYGATWSQRDYIARSFVGGVLRSYDSPATADDDAVPWEYRLTRWKLRTSGIYGFGDRKAVLHRISVGHLLASQRPTFFGAAPANAAVRDDVIKNVFPRSEFASELFVSYQLFTPNYRTFRNVDSFDVGEDTRLGPYVTAEIGGANGLLGSERDYLRGSIAGMWTLPVAATGFLDLIAGGETRIEQGMLIDNSAYAEARLVSPRLGLGRLVSEVAIASLFRETQNRFYELGGDTGLRGYETGEFTGARRARWSTDFRTSPVKVAFLRLGGVLFYDVGSAAASFGDMRLHHDAGLGIRVLIPQTSADVLRIDWAIPLDDEVHHGFPGRITAGFLQAF